MNPWLSRLKNQNNPGTQATKPTKPATDTHARGFVGFVAHPHGTFEKYEGPSPAAAMPQAAPDPSRWRSLQAEAERLAALQPGAQPQARNGADPDPDPDPAAHITSACWLLHYPDRDPVQLVSHPPASLAQILQQHPEALAAEPLAALHPAPGLALDADRSCWPHSSAMNAQEIDTFTARLGRFTDKGMGYDEAEALADPAGPAGLADKLVLRDREADDRRLCLECRHLHGWPGRWRCGNWQQAGMARDGLARDLVLMLQRCNGYHPALQQAPAPALNQPQQPQPLERIHD